MCGKLLLSVSTQKKKKKGKLQFFLETQQAAI
jgi:hypothetical protein